MSLKALSNFIRRRDSKEIRELVDSRWGGENDYDFCVRYAQQKIVRYRLAMDELKAAQINNAPPQNMDAAEREVRHSRQLMETAVELLYEAITEKPAA